MEKLEKMIIDVNEKFDTHVNMFKAGGRIMVFPEKGHIVESKKMVDIREYIFARAEELEEEDDNI